jgi:hypothetical protein
MAAIALPRIKYSLETSTPHPLIDHQARETASLVIVAKQAEPEG